MDIVDPTSPISPEELSEIQLSRRVLDRLDEETEEDTDVGGSLTGEDASSNASRPTRPTSRAAAAAVAVGAGAGGETDPWEDLEGESGSGDGSSGGSRVNVEDDKDTGAQSTVGGVSTREGQRGWTSASADFVLDSNSQPRQERGPCDRLAPPPPPRAPRAHGLNRFAE